MKKSNINEVKTLVAAMQNRNSLFSTSVSEYVSKQNADLEKLMMLMTGETPKEKTPETKKGESNAATSSSTDSSDAKEPKKGTKREVNFILGQTVRFKDVLSLKLKGENIEIRCNLKKDPKAGLKVKSSARLLGFKWDKDKGIYSATVEEIKAHSTLKDPIAIFGLKK